MTDRHTKMSFTDGLELFLQINVISTFIYVNCNVMFDYNNRPYTPLTSVFKRKWLEYFLYLYKWHLNPIVKIIQYKNHINQTKQNIITKNRFYGLKFSTSNVNTIV